VKTEGVSLESILLERRSAILKEWLERTLGTYPDSTARLFARVDDRFRNPVGHTFREVLPALLDSLLRSADTAALVPLLDRIVRLRAVQDFTASQAVAFVFLLKRVIRGELEGQAVRGSEEMAALEARIDELGLLAFDVFMKCREQIYELKAREFLRRMPVRESPHQRERRMQSSEAR
jgi:hypothetical protein